MVSGASDARKWINHCHARCDPVLFCQVPIDALTKAETQLRRMGVGLRQNLLAPAALVAARPVIHENAHALTRIPFPGTLTLRFPTFFWLTRPRSCIDGGYQSPRARGTAAQASGCGWAFEMCTT